MSACPREINKRGVFNVDCVTYAEHVTVITWRMVSVQLLKTVKSWEMIIVEWVKIDSV